MTTPDGTLDTISDTPPPDDWTEILVDRDVDLTALIETLNEAYDNPSGLQVNVSSNTTLPGTPDNPASLFVGAPGRVFPPEEVRAHLDSTPVPEAPAERPAKGPARIHREANDPRGNDTPAEPADASGGSGGGGKKK